MDISCPQRQDAHTCPVGEGAGKSSQFKGIRMRKWGKWVSEVRIPKSRAKIWLGSYATPDQAARAYDAAVLCLRGPSAKFNFPSSIPDIPSASSLSRHQIQVAAAKHALGQIPAACNWSHTQTVLTGEVASPSTMSPMEASTDSQLQSPLGEWDSFWGDSGGNLFMGLEKMPSFDMAATDIVSTIDAPAPGSIFFDPPDLWNL